MPRLIFTAGAARGILRCRRFLTRKNKAAAVRAAGSIESRFAELERHPEIGRPFREAEHTRELVIPFGDSGYLALYRYDREKDAVVILAFRHQREVEY